MEMGFFGNSAGFRRLVKTRKTGRGLFGRAENLKYHSATLSTTAAATVKLEHTGRLLRCWYILSRTNLLNSAA